MDLPGSDWGDFSCRRAVHSSSFLCLCYAFICLYVCINIHMYAYLDNDSCPLVALFKESCGV